MIGKISEQEVIVQFLALLGAGIGTSYLLDQWAGHETPILLYLTLFGSFISYIYSAPPLKLKQSGWAGNYALGASYIALPWWAGQVGGISRYVGDLGKAPLKRWLLRVQS
jgi:chlorophyll synthase